MQVLSIDDAKLKMSNKYEWERETRKKKNICSDNIFYSLSISILRFFFKMRLLKTCKSQVDEVVLVIVILIILINITVKIIKGFSMSVHIYHYLRSTL